MKRRGIDYEQAVVNEQVVRALSMVCDGCGHINTQYVADLQEMLSLWYTVKRTRTPKKLPILSSCERCGGTEFRNIESTKPVIRPSCGVRALSFRLVGYS